MAEIMFEVEINNDKVSVDMELEGQDLYYFTQRDDKGKEEWIKCYLNKKMKINDIKIN